MPDAGTLTGPLAVAGAGVLLAYSGLKGHGFLSTLRALLHGQAPSTVPASEPIGAAAAPGAATSPGGATAPAGGAPSSAADLANQTLGRAMAAAYGWGAGQQWTALNNIVMAESGWDAYAKNPSSTASGIAQNINGFGPGYQEGNAPQQIAWMLSYIKGRYGTPVAAWQFHLANGWY